MTGKIGLMVNLLDGVNKILHCALHFFFVDWERTLYWTYPQIFMSYYKFSEIARRSVNECLSIIPAIILCVFEIGMRSACNAV